MHIGLDTVESSQGSNLTGPLRASTGAADMESLLDGDFQFTIRNVRP